MLEIVPVSALSFAQWSGLWLAYVEGQLDPQLPLHRHTHERLCAAQELQGLVAMDGEPLGLVHYYFHPSTWASTRPCYIQDLYVTPAARGRGLAQALIQAVSRQAEAAGSHVLHWNTRAGNQAAVGLYERIAQRSDRVMFTLSLRP